MTCGIITDGTLIKSEPANETHSDTEETRHARYLNGPARWLEVLEAVAKLRDKFLQCVRFVLRDANGLRVQPEEVRIACPLQGLPDRNELWLLRALLGL